MGMNVIFMKNENIKKNTVISIIFTAAILIGIAVCCICDFAIAGTLTWSLIALSSIMLAWIISFPIILLGKRGIGGGILSLSIFIIPFLYIMSILIENTAVFRIGSVISVLMLIYTWGIYALFTHFKDRKMLATGFTLFLAIPFMFLINMTLSIMIAEPILDIWDALSAFILLLTAFSFMFGDHARSREAIK